MAEEESTTRRFDDDAPEDVVVETPDKPKKGKKLKVDKEGSKKNKKGFLKGKFKKILIGGGIILGLVAGGLALNPSQDTKPAPSAPLDAYYLTVNFGAIENANVDDLYIYSEGSIHTLVYMEDGDTDALAVCDNYIIEDAKSADAGCTLTPLEGTELFESIIREADVATADKVNGFDPAGTDYYISVDSANVKAMAKDSDCANIVTQYTDADGVQYDNLSDFLDAKPNSNDLSRSK